MRGGPVSGGPVSGGPVSGRVPAFRARHEAVACSATAPRRARGEVLSALADRLGSTAEARWMLEHVAGRHGDPVHAPQLVVLDDLVARRMAGEPLQYLLGTWPFRTLELVVDRRALIPRPETEQVVEAALAELRRSATGRAVGRAVALDLGTGTGAIALALAVELAGALPDLEVWAVDVDPDALALARENLARVDDAAPSAGAGRRVHLRHGDWFAPVPAALRAGIDLVVANPPYVAEDEWPALQREVWCEPRQALVAPAGSDGTPGLAAVEAVLAGAREWLRPGGAVVVELAPHQAGAGERCAHRLGYSSVVLATDLAGRDRAVVART